MKLKKRTRRGSRNPHAGPCFKKDCKQAGSHSHTCITCEELVKAGKAKEVFEVRCCDAHYYAGLGRARRHAITAHPVNVLKVVVAGFKGEEI